MIEISNLRKYVNGETVRLEADIKFLNMTSICPAKTIYFEIAKEQSFLFSANTYDAFVLVGLYLAMCNHTDLRIRGNISKKLYKNLTWYVQKILCDFSGVLTPAKIFVESFTTPTPVGNVIGTGISCGVDSLSTLYERFIKEDDPDYKINALFIFNCGSHGDFDWEHTQTLFKSRVKRAFALADELDLPVVAVDTNLHQFRNEENKDVILHLAFYSCVLGMQNGIRRYYVPSTCSYEEIKRYGKEYKDLAGFADSYLIPLIQTEQTELIIDGCQYRRVDKIKKIADWDVAKKYLNVCLSQKSADSANCGHCSKCLRTLLTIEILGKLENFAKVFDIEAYKDEALNYKVECLLNADKKIFHQENIALAKEMNFPMPLKRTCYVLDNHFMIVEGK